MRGRMNFVLLKCSETDLVLKIKLDNWLQINRRIYLFMGSTITSFEAPF